MALSIELRLTVNNPREVRDKTFKNYFRDLDVDSVLSLVTIKAYVLYIDILG